MTPDPAGFADVMNLYAYLRNNPFRYVDPDGRLAFAIPLLSFGVGIEFVALAKAAVTVLAFAVGWYTYEGIKQLDASLDDGSVMNTEQAEGESTSADPGNRSKYEDPRFPGPPQHLEDDADWNETTHPEARKRGHREFENGKTGEKIRFDKGDPTKTGHRANDHYHRYNGNNHSE